MTSYQAYHQPDVEQEPVSPISPRSEALWQKQPHSAGAVSPQDDLRKSYPPAHIFAIPPRKPVATATRHSRQQHYTSRSETGSSSTLDQTSQSMAQAHIQPKSQHDIEVYAMPRMSEQFLQFGQKPSSSPTPQRTHTQKTSTQRPRSQSFHLPMPSDHFLQDFQKPAPPKPIAQVPQSIGRQPQPSRSENISYDQAASYGRKRCNKCGISETPDRRVFVNCRKCKIYWCTAQCYQGHICQDKASNQPPRAHVPRPSEQRPQREASNAPGHPVANKSSRPTAGPDVEAQISKPKGFRHSTAASLMLWSIPLVIIVIVCLILGVKYSA